MGNEESGETESFESGMLEHPHYTRPAEFEGKPIPPVLTSGNHGNVDVWRKQQSLELTTVRRPDLLANIPGTPVEIMPALPVRDLTEGVEFYVGTLGFECVYLDEGGTAVLQLGQIELHLWLSNDESWKTRDLNETQIETGAETFIAGTHSCRIRVNGVHALYENYKKLKSLHPNSKEPEKKPWGATEFGILDPYGNLLIFFEWL